VFCLSSTVLWFAFFPLTSGNHRILYFAAGSLSASRVYGQSSFTTCSYAATTQTSLYLPSSIAVSANGLYVVDTCLSQHTHLRFSEDWIVTVLQLMDLTVSLHVCPS
jgi:hypothetical protein